jgi:hypothetical protein
MDRRNEETAWRGLVVVVLYGRVLVRCAVLGSLKNPTESCQQKELTASGLAAVSKYSIQYSIPVLWCEQCTWVERISHAESTGSKLMMCVAHDMYTLVRETGILLACHDALHG